MEEKSAQNNKHKKAMGDELIFPIMALAFAVYYLFTIWDLAWEAQINGMLIGTILIGLILAFLVKTAVQWFKGKISLRCEEFLSFGSLQRRKIGILLLAVSYVFFMQWLGFTLTTVLFLIASMVALGVRSRPMLLGISLTLSLLGYIFFVVLLDTRFPSGPFERLMERLF